MKAPPGFTLLELMISMALAGMLMVSMVALAQSVRSGVQVQQAVSQLLGELRFAANTLSEDIQAAGHVPDPWDGHAVSEAVGGHSSSTGPVLELTTVVSRNCFGRPNPIVDHQGLPVAFLKRIRYYIVHQSLVRHCEYGPRDGPLVAQANNLTLANGVQSLHLKLAEDLDGDGAADRWVGIGRWQNEASVLGIHFALVGVSDHPVGAPPAAALRVLGDTYLTPDDGHLRFAWESLASIRSREQ